MNIKIFKRLLFFIFFYCSFNAYSQINNLQLAYKHYALDNGLEVILQPDKTVKYVSVEFWLRDGINIDKPHQYGLQHFFEHVMPYSPMDSIKRETFFDRYLLGSNAQVKKDFSRFYLKTLPEGLELTLERASGRLKAGASRITEKSVEYQRIRVLEEIERNAKNPHWSAQGSLEIYEGTFGKGHPYAANGYGKLEYNKKFTLEDFRARYENIVYGGNIILFVVGNFDTLKTEKQIQQYFKDVVSKQKPIKVIKPTTHANQQITMKAPHPKDTLNTMVFSWAAPKWGTDDAAVVKLFTAHLNHIFKEENYFPESVVKKGAYTDMFAYAGQFYIRVQFTKKEHFKKIQQLVLKEIKKLTRNKITKAELDNAQQTEINNIYEMQKNLGFQSSRTELLGKSLLFTGNPNAYFEQLKTQQQINQMQIKKVAKRWLKKKPFIILFTSNLN